MHQCKHCKLAFDDPKDLNAQGICKNCAPAVTSPQQQQANDQTEIDRLRNALSDMEGRFNRAMSGGGQPQMSQEEYHRQMNAAYWQDPFRVGTQQAAQAAQQVVGAALAQDHPTMVEFAVETARKSFNREGEENLFDKYFDQIKQVMEQYQPPQAHRNAAIWKNMAKFVFGNNLQEISATARDTQKEDQEERTGNRRAPAVRTSDGPGAPSVRSAPSTAPKKEPLSELANQIRNRLEQTEDQFRYGMEAFQNQGDDSPEAVKRPSSWDKHISFDNSSGQLGKRLAKERKQREAEWAEVQR